MQEGSNKVDMDIGYGAVVEPPPVKEELVETRRSGNDESKALTTASK